MTARLVQINQRRIGKRSVRLYLNGLKLNATNIPAGGGWGCEPVGADRPTKTSCSGLQGVPRAARMHPTPRAQACRSSDQRSEALQPFGARLRDRWAHSRTGAGRLVQERNENVSCVCSKHAHESQLDNTIEQALMQLAERMPSMKHEHARARAQRKRI